ncbi:MAG TPA: thiosulfate oxidation carrier protein SoxY [Alphaproteobacteria bacterium]|nr:thiosulfate oxidation carrier protein SoxY [Alphaproteobacteria bacterium]
MIEFRSGDVARRVMLKGVAAVAGLACVGVVDAVRTPVCAADAAGWPAEAFKQKSEADVIKALYAGKTAAASDKVKLDAPEIAENGAVVPISVATDLPDVTSISVLVLENPYTLAAHYKLPAGTAPAVSNRLKMAKTTKVVALVEAGGALHRAEKEVKVTVGGCGG